jgi:hypothetical protein
MTEPAESARPYAMSALPSVTARLLAFVAILVGGACGGLIGYSVTDLQCGNGDGGQVIVGPPAASSVPTTTMARATDERVNRDNGGCATWSGGGGVLGALVGAGGTAVVAVLVLRAMAEWRRDLDVEEPPDGS